MPRPKRTKIMDTRPSSPPLPTNKPMSRQATNATAPSPQAKSNLKPKFLEHGSNMKFPASSSSSPAVPPASISRPHPTPSFVPLSSFKRRPRQPSLLRMVQQESSDADADNNDSDVEDSILRDLEGPSPNIRLRAGHNDSLSPRKRKSAELDRSEVILNAFSTVSPRVSPGLDITGSNQRHSGPRSTTISNSPAKRLSSTRSKRPRRGEGQLVIVPSPSSSPPLPITGLDRLSRPLPPTTSRQQKSSQRSTRPPGQSRRRTLRMAHDIGITQSSSSPLVATSPISSASSETCLTTPKQRSKVKVTHRRQKSAPSNGQAETTIKQKHHPTTAALQALLPRRKLPKHFNSQQPVFESLEDANSFELHSPSLSDRSLEANSQPYSGNKKRRIGKRQPLAARSANVAAAKRVKTPVKKANKQGKPTVESKRAKTYARRQSDLANASDNDASSFGYGVEAFEEADTSLSMLEESGPRVVKSRELTAAVKKFEEVDHWELEFESCDVGGASSSPWR